MTGSFPQHDGLTELNILLFSSDPIALDATVCRIICVDPKHVPTITMGHKSGSGTYLDKEIELVGDDLDSFRLPDFDIMRTPLAPYRDRGIMRFLSNHFVPRPVINAEKCGGCGVCVTICPTEPKSIDWVAGDRKKPPTYNYKTCIRCYCCQELCPESSIDIRYPLVRRIFRTSR